MKESYLPAGISIDGSSISFGQIHRAFAETEYGKHLTAQIRYSRYKPAHVSKQEWIKYLGADVNNLAHMPLTRVLTRNFIRLNYNSKDLPGKAVFNTKEQEDLLLAATMHDWGEAIVGDVMYDQKSKQFEKKEMDALEILVSDFSQNGANLRIRRVIEDVLKNTENKLGRAFNTIERAGYVRTSLRAWKSSSMVKGEDPAFANHLEWLSSNVLGNHISVLIRRARVYPAVHQFLNINKSSITEVFKVDKSVFDHYPEKERWVQQEKFYTARKHWHESMYGPEKSVSPPRHVAT